MPKARRLLTNFSKGELSPLIEGRPDLAAYFEGGRIIENFTIMRQGGLNRRFGTRFIREVKDSTRDTVLLPFEASVENAFIIEAGNSYMRFYKDKDRIGGDSPIETSTPYVEAQLRAIHFTQSVDVMYLFNPIIPQHSVSHVSDTIWAIDQVKYSPPPSFEDDTSISAGIVTLTPAAVSGTNIIMTASAPVFFPADVNRIIRQKNSGNGRALIKSIGVDAGDTAVPNVTARVDILDTFPNTGHINPFDWFLTLSPQTKLDPNIKGPVNAVVTLTAEKAAFRPEDVDKFIAIYGGLVKIDFVDSRFIVRGTILSEMSGTDVTDPPAAEPGAWTLEIESWSEENGYPRTGEFFQGRLGQAATEAQPTTWWLSTSDGFDNYATGATADRAVEYTIAARKLNRIEWLGDQKDLFIGTSGSELRALSGKTDEPFGGDVIPVVNKMTAEGSAPVQAVVMDNRIIYLDRSRKKLFQMVYDFYTDNFDSVEITSGAGHIFGDGGVRLGPIATTRRPDPCAFYVRDDGQLVVLTFVQTEKIIGFTRLTTDGFFEAVGVKPGAPTRPDEVWVVVRRTINGVSKRYIEVLEDNHESLIDRKWKSLQTDCAIVYRGAPTSVVTGLAHLEGKVVDVVADGGFRGTYTVSGGQITLNDSYTEIEVGLHYKSTAQTMEPAIEGQVIAGMPRSWDKIFVRLYNSIGGRANGKAINYKQDPLGTLTLKTGKFPVTPTGWDLDGYLTIEQDEPYPMTLLNIFGTLSVADSD